MTNPLAFNSKLEQSYLSYLRKWIDNLEIKNPITAKLICSLIPATCPFERRIKICDRTVLYIPPLCHFNPVYNELIDLRFRALVFLSEQTSLG